MMGIHKNLQEIIGPLFFHPLCQTDYPRAIDPDKRALSKAVRRRDEKSGRLVASDRRGRALRAVAVPAQQPWSSQCWPRMALTMVEMAASRSLVGTSKCGALDGLGAGLALGGALLVHPCISLLVAGVALASSS